MSFEEPLCILAVCAFSAMAGTVFLSRNINFNYSSRIANNHILSTNKENVDL